jgi:hypothetical protein
MGARSLIQTQGLVGARAAAYLMGQRAKAPLAGKECGGAGLCTGMARRGGGRAPAPTEAGERAPLSASASPRGEVPNARPGDFWK